MSIRESYPHGVFSWADFFTPNMAEARAFYCELFGWRAEAQGDDEGTGQPYVMFFKGDHPVAGGGEMSADMKSSGMPAMWNSYVSVEDLDATLERVRASGGTVTMGRHEVEGAGVMAFIQDPTGAALALWQATGHIGSGLADEPGALCWNELVTRELNTAKRFYAEVFGWSFEDAQLDHPYAFIVQGGEMIGGVMLMDEEWGEMPPHWMIYFAVDDCDQSVERLERLGGKRHMEPVDIDPGRFCVVSDPHGANFTIMKLNQSA